MGLQSFTFRHIALLPPQRRASPTTASAACKCGTCGATRAAGRTCSACSTSRSLKEPSWCQVQGGCTSVGHLQELSCVPALLARAMITKMRFSRHRIVVLFAPLFRPWLGGRRPQPRPRRRPAAAEPGRDAEPGRGGAHGAAQHTAAAGGGWGTCLLRLCSIGGQQRCFRAS